MVVLFKSPKKVYVNDQEVLSELALPDEIAGSANQYMLHPSLMDGVLRTIFYIYHNEGDGSVFHFR